MAAPDLATLYSIEETFDTYLAGEIATAVGLPSSQVLHAFSGSDATQTPRIEVETVVGAGVGLFKTGTDPELENAWESEFVVRLIADRASVTSIRLHQKTLRALFAKHQDLFGAVADLPYHCVVNFRTSSTSYSFDGETDEHLVEMTWAGVIGIVDTAWPA
tara:strand:- start:454 stop:936 length:483 start_codon:yes stop_codon:yes gene_type:complete